LASRNHKLLVVALAGLAASASGVSFLRAGAAAMLINVLVAAKSPSPSVLTATIALTILASILPDLVHAALNYVDRRFHISMEQEIELLVLGHKGEIDVAAYDDPKFNDLLHRAEGRGTLAMVDLLQAQVSNVQNAVKVAIASIVLMAADARIFALVVLGTLPRFLAELQYGRGVWSIYDANAETRRRFFYLRWNFFDLRSLTELKLYQDVRHFHGLLASLMGEFSEQQRGVERRKLIWLIAAILSGGACVGLAVVMLVGTALDGKLSVGTMAFILGSIATLQIVLSEFSLSAAHQYQCSLFTTDLFRIMDVKPLLARPENPRTLDASRAPSIVFENVSFTYPGTEKTVLHGISLGIRPGERLAIVGVNGAGKTTLVKLLCRIYDPTDGRILVNGCDLREVNLAKWHEMLGVLLQDYASYHFPVKEVIALGRRNGSPDLRMDDVRSAARRSGADAFIERWKHRYDQMLGRQYTDGVDPSKGQLQKLAIARSFYRDARVMILDEPTSSIDAEGETRVLEQFEALSGDTTVLLISHRLSSVKRADRICVLDNGAIAELGTHDALLKLGAIYARLFQLQAAGYREPPEDA
jgi:ATP-binding cassette subfamily B protein